MHTHQKQNPSQMIDAVSDNHPQFDSLMLARILSTDLWLRSLQMHSSPRKFTLKVRRGENGSYGSTLPDLTLRVKKEENGFSGSTSLDHLGNTIQKPIDLTSSEEEEDDSGDDDDSQSREVAQKQLVVYDPAAANVTDEIEAVLDPNEYQPPPFPRKSLPFRSSSVLPAVGAFTVQCSNCFKWRLIPTKEKYEEIRGHILDQPFLCEAAREWRPEISCEDPPDICQDDGRLWAIDKPNIAQPPPGWERLLRIRGEGSSKFADVYYVAPSGKRLRSMVEIQRYLLEHPQYMDAGVNMSQFSFQTPQPLQENYVRKRPARLEPPDVNPLAWLGPPEPRNRPAKKKARIAPSRAMCGQVSACDQNNGVKREEPL